MYSNYKIYHNDSYLLITGDRSQMNKSLPKVLAEQRDIEDFLNNPFALVQ